MTSQNIAIINLNTGNLTSLFSRLQQISVHDKITILEPSEIIKNTANIDKLILPGVGNFAYFSNTFFSFDGLEDAIKNFIKTKPMLGICVGMQFLFNQSNESGINKGLGLIDGIVERFTDNPNFDQSLKVPHMGWNDVRLASENHKANFLFKDLLSTKAESKDFYFVHSYYCKANNPLDIVATTDYSIDIPAVVAKDNIYGMQFHPEKSSTYGEIILTNFLQRA